jgi:type I restriction enzyme S subunit
MYYIVTPDTFAYNPARINVGSIGYDDLDKDVIVSSLYVIFKTDCKTNNYFLDKWFKTPHFKKLINLYQEGGVRLYFFYDKLCQCHLFRPELKEQQSIANYFKSLDSMIQGVTKKIASLKQMKQACLVSMFPQAGETTPRVRFKGFKGEWVIRNMSDLLIERNIQSPKSSEYPLMAFIANKGIVDKGERYDRSALINDAENKLYKKTEKGDFIYSSNNLETGSIGLNKYGNATISPVYSIFRPTGIADSDFIGRRFIRKDFINEMVKWRQGVIYGQWKIHEEDFLKIEVMVPSLEEQRRIGSFLDNLDHLITLHQRKKETIINQRKTLQQYLLNGIVRVKS